MTEWTRLHASRKLAHQAGGCMHCRHGSSTYVWEFQMGTFVARLCRRCLNDLIESVKGAVE